MIPRAIVLSFFVGFLCLASLFAQTQDAQESTSSAPAPSAAGPRATPPDPLKVAQYRGFLEQANELLEKKKYAEALTAVQKAEEISQPNAITLNLRGAIMAKQKKFDEARGFYDKAIKADPAFFPAEYNIGEIDFEKGDYTKAADYFKKMLTDYPGNELLQFMVFVCYIQLDNKAEAEKWMNSIRFPSNSPSWYYAKAVWELKNGNKSEAQSYLRGSAYIFGDKNRLFDETLTEVKLLPIK